MKLKLGMKIYGAFGAVLLLMFIVGGYGYISMNQMQEEVHFTRMTAYPAADSAAKMKFATVQVQQWLTDSSATGWSDGFDEAEKYAVMFRSESDKLKEIHRDDPVELGELEELDESFEDYYDMGKRMAHAYVDEGREEGNKVMKEFDAYAEDLSNRMDHIKDENDVQFSQSLTRAHELTDSIKRTNLLLSILAVVLATLVGFALVRSIKGPIVKLADAAGRISGGDLTQDVDIKASGDEIGDLVNSFGEMMRNLRLIVTNVQGSSNTVASSAQQLAAASEEMNATTEGVSTTVQHISDGAQNQSTQVKNASSELENLAKMTESISESSQSAAEISNKAKEKAEAGAEAAGEAVQKMEEIHRVVNNSAEVVQELGGKSQEIGEIVDLITNIADQTNLLALNAAIEAARAGEHGRGFAVVAEEVKKLAEESAQAADQISDLVKDIQGETGRAVESMKQGTNEVTEGTEVVEKALTALQEIVEVAVDAASKVQEISATTQEQTAIAEKVVTTIDEISTMAEEASAGTEEASAATEEQTSSMEQVTASAQELSKIAEDLQVLVSEFRLNGHETQTPRVEPGIRGEASIIAHGDGESGSGNGESGPGAETTAPLVGAFNGGVADHSNRRAKS